MTVTLVRLEETIRGHVKPVTSALRATNIFAQTHNHCWGLPEATKRLFAGRPDRW
jgi:hypothetical protein